MYKVPWHVWLPPLSLGLHLHHHWSCGVCIQVVAIWQFMMTMVLDHNVNDVRWKNKTERNYCVVDRFWQLFSATGVHIGSSGWGQQVLGHSAQIAHFTGDVLWKTMVCIHTCSLLNLFGSYQIDQFSFQFLSTLSWFPQTSWERCLELWLSVEIWRIWPEHLLQTRSIPHSGLIKLRP